MAERAAYSTDPQAIDGRESARGGKLSRGLPQRRRVVTARCSEVFTIFQLLFQRAARTVGVRLRGFSAFIAKGLRTVCARRQQCLNVIDNLCRLRRRNSNNGVYQQGDNRDPSARTSDCRNIAVRPPDTRVGKDRTLTRR